MNNSQLKFWGTEISFILGGLAIALSIANSTAEQKFPIWFFPSLLGLGLITLSIVIQFAKDRPQTNKDSLWQEPKEKSISEEHLEMWTHAYSAADTEIARLKELGKVSNPQTKWLELVNQHMSEQLTLHSMKYTPEPDSNND